MPIQQPWPWTHSSWSLDKLVYENQMSTVFDTCEPLDPILLTSPPLHMSTSSSPLAPPSPWHAGGNFDM